MPFTVSHKQADFINKEYEKARAVINSGGTKGMFRWAAREEALRLMIQLTKIKD